MGNVYSFSSPPPGAAVLEIESRECCASCGPRKWDTFMTKPPQAGVWPDGQWSQFSSEMGAQVQRFKRDGYAGFGLLLIPVGLVFLLISFGSDVFPLRGIIHVPFIIAALVLFWAINGSFRNANRAIDADIEALCRRHSDGSVTLQYATEFTGQCKPKGARTYRALYIIPGGAAGSAQVVMQPQPGMAVATASPATTQMQVACPPGSKPGDPIMIQAPGGVQCQVVVPDGVAPGQVFMVQVPVQPVVATVMATAVPPV
jgi:hypothetical protein